MSRKLTRPPFLAAYRLATHVADEIDAAQRTPDRRGDEPQRVVAPVVPEIVVDALEVIHVDDQKRAALLLHPHIAQIGIDERRERAAAQHFREAVPRRKQGEFVMGDRQLTELAGKEENERPGDHERNADVGQDGAVAFRHRKMAEGQ